MKNEYYYIGGGILLLATGVVAYFAWPSTKEKAAKAPEAAKVSNAQAEATDAEFREVKEPVNA